MQLPYIQQFELRVSLQAILLVKLLWKMGNLLK